MIHELNKGQDKGMKDLRENFKQWDTSLTWIDLEEGDIILFGNHREVDIYYKILSSNMITERFVDGKEKDYIRFILEEKTFKIPNEEKK
jgi:hypothetical protein